MAIKEAGRNKLLPIGNKTKYNQRVIKTEVLIKIILYDGITVKYACSL